MIRAGIVGASGYTGVELLRILWGHPEFEVTIATAGEYAGTAISSLYPSLAGFYDGKFTTFDESAIEKECDVAFVGLPHGESMRVVPGLLASGKKVVDLSADFRLSSPGEYEKWYGIPHASPELLPKAVYGLPEFRREDIRGAELVANPGCYPTSVLLGIHPVAKAGLIGGTVVVDSKSGISGAGRKLTLATHFPQAADGISVYAVSGHRHLPEMLEQAGNMATGEVDIVFTPHLVPMNRGILSTIYVPVDGSPDGESISRLYRDACEDEPFVEFLEGSYPETKAVQGTNNCHIAVELAGDTGMLVAMSVIDNLVKGASGQAVQCMNIMCGLPERDGLAGPGLFP